MTQITNFTKVDQILLHGYLEKLDGTEDQAERDKIANDMIDFVRTTWPQDDTKSNTQSDMWLYSCVFDCSDGVSECNKRYDFELQCVNNLERTVRYRDPGLYVKLESLSCTCKKFFTVFHKGIDELPISSKLKLFETEQEWEVGEDCPFEVLVWINGKAYNYKEWRESKKVTGLTCVKQIRR